MSAFPRIPVAFDRPRSGEVDVLVVAGEHSGDQHAAKVVAELLKARPGLRVAAFGGPDLKVAGAQVLVRSYSASEPCSWVYAEDPEHFACPFAAGDAWSWDGADTIEQRREAPEGPSTLTLARGG